MGWVCGGTSVWGDNSFWIVFNGNRGQEIGSGFGMTNGHEGTIYGANSQVYMLLLKEEYDGGENVQRGEW